MAMTINPATNQEVEKYPDLTDDQLDRALERAHRAYLSWRETAVERRADVVRRVGALMLERHEDLARLLTLEMGKLIKESENEVRLAASIFTYYGDQGPGFITEETIDVAEGQAVVVTQPIGALIGVEPWNFPYSQVARFAAPNVVLGNTVLVKHASQCPQSALALERLFRDAGAPEGVYTNLFIKADQVARAIDSPLIAGASLTGSEAAGASVGQAAGRNLKKVVLELGGSDPFIVLDEDRFEHTIKAAILGRLANTGQSCVASKRFIVLEPYFDKFVEGMRAGFAGLRVGDPMDPQTQLGPLSSEDALKHLEEQVNDAKRKGAKVVIGGNRIERPGAYYEATILTGVTPEMRAYREELFGPVAVVYAVDDERAAIELANDSPFGLGATVIASDLKRARAVAQRIESGMVWINHPTASAPNLPFGGVKRSGVGRELWRLGMQEFTNRKLIRTLPADVKLEMAAG
jgi:succinate-semialdehyde dehydrogenase/glutarate-semialdehyde dehydrogenase